MQLRAELPQDVDLRPAKLALGEMTLIRFAGGAFGASHDLFVIQMLRKLVAQVAQGRNGVGFPPQTGEACLALRDMPVNLEQFRRREGAMPVAVELLFGEMFGLLHRRLSG